MTQAIEAPLIAARLPAPGEGGGYLLGLSGGLDSTVLLHALIAAGLRPQLRVIHVNHGLHPDAARWAEHCAALCRAQDVAFEALTVQVPAGPRRSIEAEARAARYAALSAAMRPGDVLLTAHHLDDQAETVLIQLLRGSGVRGLAAMPMCAAFGPGRHVRPLLGFKRAAFEAYAREHHLEWIEDPANADHRFARNLLRHRVMPVLREYWPDAAAMLGRSAALCGEVIEVLDAMGKADLESCAAESADALRIAVLRELSVARRHNVLRFWIESLGLPMPPAGHLDRLEQEVLDASPDATPVLGWPGAELRRYRECLYVMRPLAEAPGAIELSWTPGTVVELPRGCGCLESQSSTSHAAATRLRSPAPGETPRIRFSQGGERLRLPGRTHHHAIKDLMQQAGVPPWVRRRLPLIYYGDNIAAVADLCVCEGYAARTGAGAWSLRWLNPPPGYAAPRGQFC